ncbi:hypothetical protein HER18_02910 [Chryseobacterium sp. NEB161]|nr:hypothetical protein HER18_02910 [Chryseobacterium sp. NEB161]
MPVNFISQPAQSELLTAYKPVNFVVSASTNDGNVPPVVYCDVYINSAYYRTFFSTKSQNNQFSFDIQDAVQEVFTYYIPPMDGGQLQINKASLVDVFVKIRTSKLNSLGLIETEQTAPIPGNDDEKPISGSGSISNKIYVLNALIQNEENQNIFELLKSFRRGTWNNEALPLTRRNEVNFIQAGQSSYFPILTEKDIAKVKLSAKFKDGSIRDYYSEIVPEDVVEVSNPPTINIKWLWLDGSENINVNTWDLRNGAFPGIKIKVYPEDPDEDIVKVELFQKTDNGAFISIAVMTDNTFDLSGLIVGNYQYKAIVTDSKNNSAESNILTYQIKDTTPAPGTITLENDDTIAVVGGSYFSRTIGNSVPNPGEEVPVDGFTYLTNYFISFSNKLKTFYENKGMIASELRIKFKNLIGYTDWRYNNSLITESNYTATEVSPDILNQFNASSNFQEIGTATIIHEFEIYHIADPSQKFTNYLQMEFS